MENIGDKFRDMSCEAVRTSLGSVWDIPAEDSITSMIGDITWGYIDDIINDYISIDAINNKL